MLKKWMTLLLLLVVVLAGCTNEQPPLQQAQTDQTQTEPQQQDSSTTETASTESGGETESSGASAEIPAAVDKPLKIALISEFSIGTFSSQYQQGVEEQVKRFGGELTVYNADNDLAKMAAHLDTAVNQKVDGILINHGRAEALQAGVERAVQAGIPVVSFDNDLDKVEGVTIMDQDDYGLAWQGLKKLAQDIDGQGQIVYIWVGGFAPMEKRNRVYNIFLQRYPNIKEIARFGSATANTALDTQAQMEAILKKYPNKGDIAAVWAPWDEFAKGATRAIKAAGRTEIKVYGIDLSDEDLQMIQEEGSPWKASAATDPADIGRVQTRFLYQKIAGEKTPKYFSLDPHLVEQEKLPDTPINMDELPKYVNGWGKSDAAISPWMSTLESKNSD
ncbi:sugar ABC transporter substrate-binding protein [Brevibacillus humidisoli]|uniref:sugar ABC transporter substrate-binding protein n=1 Tax=Brevibacillus humidisoli TaxID=2895522 RepID=UPI001E4D77C0|nr:sugar ABC transporter substrate-binding protein [Brevibacillus humidisoli]UFJ39470.1 sugar ABC transporter substrate-binding protein [Brevibacillus humidisoli]